MLSGTNPTIIFAHGAFAGSSSWNKVISILLWHNSVAQITIRRIVGENYDALTK